MAGMAREGAVDNRSVCAETSQDREAIGILREAQRSSSLIDEGVDRVHFSAGSADVRPWKNTHGAKELLCAPWWRDSVGGADAVPGDLCALKGS